MKLSPSKSLKRKSGMTLLELTVVILVLLSLISILFIGARAWKKGSDRAGCILNIRNIQQAVRGDQNMKDKVYGEGGLDPDAIFGATGYLPNEPKCPGDKSSYNGIAVTVYPAENTIYAACGNATAATAAEHVIADPTGW